MRGGLRAISFRIPSRATSQRYSWIFLFKMCLDLLFKTFFKKSGQVRAYIKYSVFIFEYHNYGETIDVSLCFRLYLEQFLKYWVAWIVIRAGWKLFIYMSGICFLLIFSFLLKVKFYLFQSITINEELILAKLPGVLRWFIIRHISKTYFIKYITY